MQMLFWYSLFHPENIRVYERQWLIITKANLASCLVIVHHWQEYILKPAGELVQLSIISVRKWLDIRFLISLFAKWPSKAINKLANEYSGGQQLKIANSVLVHFNQSNFASECVIGRDHLWKMFFNR